jgi:DNA-binding transcriptional regulator YiaG
MHTEAMPNIALVLKAEIARVARKEVRGQTTQLKKAISAHRSEIAALKRRTQELENQLRRLRSTSPRRASAESSDEAPANRRFSAKALATHRKKLGLSARECGLLIGTTGQSIYKWELGKASPRAKHLAAVDAFRRLNKKQAVERLNALG